MIQYYGYTISPNQIETGEGFLICRNVPIARTGDQDYLGREIGLTGQEAECVITVHRSPEEVFSSAALASFEGKPATNDHPPELIGPDDVAVYEKGHVQNVRRGTGEWTEYVVADLHIHDRELIEAVQRGKREISCGYECDYVDNGDGTYSQKNIRGNHVAVVERGRAGKRAAILDSDIKKVAETPPERKVTMKQAFLKLFGLAARDKTPEEIAKLAMDTADALNEGSGGSSEGTEPGPSGSEPGKEEAQKNMDEGTIDDLVEKIMERMAAKKAAEEAAENKDPLDAMIEKLTEKAEDTHPEEGEGGEARVIQAEKAEQIQGMDKALAAGILKAMRPAVAAITDTNQRKAVSDALLECVMAKDGVDDIAKILSVSQKNAQKTADGKNAMDIDKVQAAYDRLNPHNPNYGKENK